MVYGKSFVFDGQNSKDYNLMLCSIGDDNETDINMGLNYEVSSYQTNEKTFDYGAKHSDVLTFSMSVIHCDESPFDRQQIREIMRWLDDCRDLKWLAYYDSEEELNINYHCRITSKEKIKCGSNIIGLRFEVTCDSPYAYSEIKTMEIPVTNTTDDEFIFSRQFYVNTDKYICPCIYFYLYTPPGELNYTYFRASVTSKDSDKNYNSSNFSCVYEDKILIMDCENECIFFDDMTIPNFNVNLYKDCQFADNFIQLNHGLNTVTCRTNKSCNKIELKYREIYKTGEF